MREILFRGKRVDNGEWIEGDLVTQQYPIYKELHSPLITDKDGVWEVVPKTVGQFIATLPNKNKVFDNSILQIVTNIKCKTENDCEQKTRIDTAQIRFNTRQMQYELKVYHDGKYKRIANAGYFFNSFDTKVIGTIFDKEVEE